MNRDAPNLADGRSIPTQDCHDSHLRSGLGPYIPLGSFVLSRTDISHFRDLHGRLEGTDWSQAFLSADWSETSHECSWLYLSPPCSSLSSLCREGWLRIFTKVSSKDPNLVLCRVYVLPDDVWRSLIDRDNVTMKRALQELVDQLDLSKESWNDDGSDPSKSHAAGHHRKTDTESLFYIFNTLESPRPSSHGVACLSSRESIDAILDASAQLSNLRSSLYPYQRRSAAEMIRREVDIRRTLDPRLNVIVGPENNKYFYDRQTGIILQSERLYEETKGGILAETMGLGKTLICLSVILATKGHWPGIPPEYSLGLHPIRPHAGSLKEMTAAAVGRANIPWRVSMRGYESCLKILEENIGSYTILHGPKRSLREPQKAKRETIHLCSATLIIVPANLFAQWKSEIHLHLTGDALSVLYVEDEKTPFPELEDVLRCDIIIMSKKRFEEEMDVRAAQVISSEQGETISPLRKLHFLRLIVDEGHDFASSASKSSSFYALQRLRVDRKWIVSGTPSQSLIGAEMGQMTLGVDGIQRNIAEVLKKRRARLLEVGEKKELEHLGRIVTGFFGLQPWANTGGNDIADWKWYISNDTHQSMAREPHSLRKILQSLVVRHRVEDFERDVKLPALHNRVVYVKPSWHNKMSINLFMLVLTANAVTSERVDQDYMFHPHNRGSLTTLINNLRQGGFYWTSFTPEDIRKTIDTSRKWLEKEEHHTAKYEGDRILLRRAIKAAEVAVESSSWTALSTSHEMGVFASDFPTESREVWSLIAGSGSDPTLIGAPQLADAQKHVDSQTLTSFSDPTNGLTGCGIRSMKRLKNATTAMASAKDSDKDTATIKSKATSLGRNGEQPATLFEKTQLGGSAFGVTNRKAKLLNKQTQFQEKQATPPKKRRKLHAETDVTATENSPPSLQNARATNSPQALVSLHSLQHTEMSSGSPNPQCPQSSSPPRRPHPSPLLSKIPPTTITGTASAKLSYLLSRLIQVHPTEKSLIFYEFDNIAFYTAQALDLLSIPYLIYAGSLTAKLKNTYIHSFNTSPYFRVMLMDLKQAAHGLHVASASRVFFVNPVWQPSIEAQAIKRAHRIGQKKEVFVETLVLEGTLEEELWKRRRGMSEGERRHAEKSMLDDPVMWDAIKSAQFLEVEEGEAEDLERQMTRLEVPQKVFGRGVAFISQPQREDEEFIVPASPEVPEKRVKISAACDGPSASSRPGTADTVRAATPTPQTNSVLTTPSYFTGHSTEAYSPSIFGDGEHKSQVGSSPCGIDHVGEQQVGSKSKKKVGFA